MTSAYQTYSRTDIDNPDFKLKPGSFIVTHSDNLMGWLIRTFTFSKWNHAALVIDENGGIIELQLGGIKQATIDKYPPKNFYLVDFEMSDEDRKQVIAYANFMLSKHDHYGFLTILTILAKIITKSRLVLKLDGTLICSEFVANALAEGGIIWDKDMSLITPKDLYNRFVKSG